MSTFIDRNEQFKRIEVTNYVLALLVFVILQLSAMAGQSLSSYFNHQATVAEIKQRVGLDTPHLDLGNSALNTVINESSVKYYLDKLNEHLVETDAHVRVLSIQGVTSDRAVFPEFSVEEHQYLLTTEQDIKIDLVHLPVSSDWAFSVFALIVSLGVLFIPQNRLDSLISTSKAGDVDEALVLVIDLQNKTLASSLSGLSVPLQNKPLCFYAALVNYCTAYPDRPLHLHKDIPEELVSLANRVFARLIELGHTKRKRPDFNANLDKTLSEIRAALDETFAYSPVDKEKFYPPRAQGEGSRSRQHSYALTDIAKEDVEFIGS